MEEEGQEPSHVGGLQKLEKATNKFSCRASRKE